MLYDDYIPFRVEHGVVGVGSHLVFGGVSDQALGISECHIGWGDSVTLIIGDDFNFSVLMHADTGIGGAQIDTNDFAHFFLTDCGNFNKTLWQHGKSLAFP